MRIMIVDNDPVYLGLLSEVLEMHGFEVVQAFDGEDALSKLNETTVDFVLSDISMPKMNGMNLHRYIRQDSRLRDLPFAWNSGYRELRDVVEVEDPSIDWRFDKSMTVPDLLIFFDQFRAGQGQHSNEGEAANC